MKQLLRNPFAYLSLVLFALLVFQVAQIVKGQTGGTWAPPTAPPPGGQPVPPLDTGSEPQTKQGSLGILGNVEVKGREGLRVELNNPRITRYVQVLTATSSQIDFRDDTKSASIRFFNGQLQARHDPSVDGSWFTLGTGGAGYSTVPGGGGESVLSTEGDTVVMSS